MESEGTEQTRRSLTDHPGYLGYGSIFAIHADWPAYPCEPGGNHGLFDLAQFPEGTKFTPIDDIDLCILFSAHDFPNGGSTGVPKAPLSKDAYQVAIWHDDLLSLTRQGLISGVRAVSEYEWEVRRRDKMRQDIFPGHAGHGDPLDLLFTKDADGTIRPVRWPPLPEPPDDEELADDPWAEDPYTWAAVDEGNTVSLTEKGWDVVSRTLGGALQLPASVAYVQQLLELNLYDTAIREIAVTIESSLRDSLPASSGRYGQKLVEEFIKELGDHGHGPNTQRSIYKLRLRAFFKFIRNEFAHNRVTLSRPRALALLSHASELLRDIEGLLSPKGNNDA